MVSSSSSTTTLSYDLITPNMEEPGFVSAMTDTMSATSSEYPDAIKALCMRFHLDITDVYARLSETALSPEDYALNVTHCLQCFEPVALNHIGNRLGFGCTSSYAIAHSIVKAFADRHDVERTCKYLESFVSDYIAARTFPRTDNFHEVVERMFRDDSWTVNLQPRTLPVKHEKAEPENLFNWIFDISGMSHASLASCCGTSGQPGGMEVVFSTETRECADTKSVDAVKAFLTQAGCENVQEFEMDGASLRLTLQHT